jgi:anti-sigma factor RsiW
MSTHVREDDLHDYADGELTSAAREPIDRHLAACPICHEALESIRRLRARLAELPSSVEPERDLLAVILARVGADASSAAAATGAAGVASAGRTDPVRDSALEPGAAHESPRSREESVTGGGKAKRENAGTGRGERSSVPTEARRLRTRALRSLRASYAIAAAILFFCAGAAIFFPRSPATPDAASVAPGAAPRTPEIAGAYAGEIGALVQALDTRRTTLRPETVRIIEDNLKIIDDAIARSQVALEEDPSSADLAQLLSFAYETKLELLRRATEISN